RLGYCKITPGATEINSRSRLRGRRHSPAQSLDQVPDIARQRRLERDLLLADGMDETQGARVQGGPADEGRGPSVAAIADQRVARLGQVDADLVPAAGAQADRQDRGRREAFRHTVLGDRLLPLPGTAG